MSDRTTESCPTFSVFVTAYAIARLVTRSVGDQGGRSNRTRGTETSLGCFGCNDFEAEHEIYHETVVLYYLQSGERIRSRRNIRESQQVQPTKTLKHFIVSRIVGSGDLWVSELVLTYDDKLSYVVSVMELEDGLVAREAQYFGDPFEPNPSRSHLVETRG
jgi:hypothetical protein